MQGPAHGNLSSVPNKQTPCRHSTPLPSTLFTRRDSFVIPSLKYVPTPPPHALLLGPRLFPPEFIHLYLFSHLRPLLLSSLLSSINPSPPLSNNFLHPKTNHFYETCLKHYYNHHASIPLSVPLSSTTPQHILWSSYCRASRGRRFPGHEGCHNTPLSHHPDFILRFSQSFSFSRTWRCLAQT